MTAVVMVADVPTTGCVPGATAIRLPIGNGPDRVTPEQFFEAVANLLEHEQTVVCVYASWQGRRTEHTIRLVRSLLGTERIVGVRSDLPPLALSLTVDLLAHLARYVPAGILVAMVSRLQREMAAGAWLRSVTKFQHAPTSLSQHVRSYLPRGAFVARISPESAVGKAGHGAAVGWRPPDPVHLLVSEHGGDEQWLRGKLTAELRPAVVRTLTTQPAAPSYWGCKQFTEFVAFSAHPDALTSSVRQIRYRPCSWCEELVSSDPCPFCMMSAQVMTFQPSHTLPESQRLPTTPLVETSNGGNATVHRSEST